MLRGTGIGRSNIGRVGNAHANGARLSTVALGALVVAAVGCSGSSSSDASPPDTSISESDPAAIAVTTDATTSPPTSAETTTPPATSPPSTTMPATTSPTTAPPTTTPPPATPEDEIRAAYEEVYRGYWGCLRAPLQCDTSWLLAESAAATAMQDTMQALADRDRFVGDDDVGYYVIRDITIAPDGMSATVVSCWWSTAVLYGAPVDPDRPAGPDNPATIVNNTPGSFVQQDELEWSAAKWSVAGSTMLEQRAQEDLCVP